MKKESSMQKLFAHAGNYKYLTIASWILSAVSALIALLPFYDIWRIMQEVVLAAPDYSKAQNLYVLGWRAVGFALLSMFIYICGLLCSHIAAFHVQANMRSILMRHILTLPMGFMESEGSGKSARSSTNPPQPRRPTWRISCRIKLERWQHLWDCCFCW